MAWDSMPVFVRIVFILLVLAFLIGIIGFATDYWNSHESTDIYGNRVVHICGLWRSCGTTVDRRTGDKTIFCVSVTRESKRYLLLHYC